MDQQATPPAGWRGGGATRLEAFVDAAFAFAVTLLVISADRVPDSVRALVLALKQVPAFAAGFALLALFWYAHVRWSRHYRLDGMLATLLSLLLVFLVLVYVYPLRLLLGTFFAWITAGWLPMPLSDVAQRAVVMASTAPPPPAGPSLYARKLRAEIDARLGRAQPTEGGSDGTQA